MANSAYLRELILARTLLSSEVLPEIFLSLHGGDPGVTGEAEVSGDGYERQVVALRRSAPATAENVGDVEFRDLPAMTVSYFGLYDARGGGSYLTGGPFAWPQDVRAGQGLRWREGEITVRVP